MSPKEAATNPLRLLIMAPVLMAQAVVDLAVVK